MTTRLAVVSESGPTALEAAEIRYEELRTELAEAQADFVDALRRANELKPIADAALLEVHVLRADAEQERLLGAEWSDLRAKIEEARLEAERADSQYSRARDAHVAAMTLEAPEPTLSMAKVALEFADEDLLAARVRLQDLEWRLAARIRTAQDAVNAKAAETAAEALTTARATRVRGWLSRGAPAGSRNGH
jgi:hypothetical protein